MMVAALPKTRSGSPEDRATLGAAVNALTGLQRQLTEAIDLDADAYGRVVAAYRLPKGTADEQAVRTATVQRALRGASDVPLDVMRLSALALKEARLVAAHGHRAAASDVRVAIGLLAAGLRGARLNVEANQGGIGDPAYVKAVTLEAGQLANDGARAAEEADTLLQK